MRGLAISMVVVLGAGATSCDGAAPHDMGVSRAALRAIDGCDGLEEVLREAAVAQMRDELMANFRSALDGDCWGRYAGEENWDAAGAADGDADPDDDGSATHDGASEYSTTNTQEVGVDEADFIKNDGSYIYLVAGRELIIVDAWPAPMAEIVSRVELAGTPRRLYVHADHAVVYSDVVDPSAGEASDCYYDDFGGRHVCGASASGTRLSVFDITDRAHPVLEREIEITGLYVNSRRIDDAIHTVMTYPEVRFPDIRTWPDGIDACGSTDRTALWLAFSDLMVRNEEIINSTPLEGWVPSLTDTTYDDAGAPTSRTGILGECRGFFEAVGASGRSFLSVMSFDLLDPDEEIGVTSIVGDQGVVYASRSAIYVASRQYADPERPWFFDADEGVSEATTVHRFTFDLDSPSTTYDASGVVAGRVLNQFSLGEHRGFLRLATTVGYLPSPDCSNNVYVLEPVDGVLEVVGSITGIAPSEDIRSARFVGDRGFIVTFKKTDPLFTLDLSDPERPFVAGELHIPGYSTYMHMLDDDHLLTIGFDAQDEGDFAWFQGVQLQIFDVADMGAPARTHLEVIGTRGTTSEATGNHLAFNYFAARELLAIPMAICEGGSGGSYGDVMTFNGLLVYDVNTAEGFREHGRVSHGTPPDGYGCSNWWTSANSHVKRSVIMDDFVFSVADDQILVSDLRDLATPVTRIELPLVPDDGDSHGY
jgi:hypothetical protein